MAVTENKRRLSRRVGRAVPLWACLLMGFSSSAQALDWLFEPRVGARTTYTDNINQGATNVKDAFIFSVVPGFMVSTEGSSRVQATLQYDLNSVARFSDNNSNDLNHHLNAVGKAELVEDFLFVDGNARISQELISLFGSPADAEINGRNRATVGTYSLSPYVKKRLGTFADVQARYTASGAIFENDVAPTAKVNSFSTEMTSGTRFNDLSWGLSYSIRKAQNKNAVDTTFETASVQLGYAPTRKLRVFGNLGQAWNEYPSSTVTDGSFYNAGFGWSPTRRTSFEVSAGEHYLGRTFSLSGIHRTRLSNWTVHYLEEVSDISKMDRYLESVTFNDCPADAVLPPKPTVLELLKAGCSVTPQFGSSITSGVYLSKSLTAGVSWKLGSRTKLDVRLSDLSRDYQLAPQGSDRVQGAAGNVSYALSPRTSANGSLSLTRTSADASRTQDGMAREDDLVSLSLGLSHRFAEDFTGTLTFRHSERDSNVASSDYKENNLSAMVNMRF